MIGRHSNKIPEKPVLSVAVERFNLPHAPKSNLFDMRETATVDLENDMEWQQSARVNSILQDNAAKTRKKKPCPRYRPVRGWDEVSRELVPVDVVPVPVVP
jgi:hypothetical protein